MTGTAAGDSTISEDLSGVFWILCLSIVLPWNSVTMPNAELGGFPGNVPKLQTFLCQLIVPVLCRQNVLKWSTELINLLP